MGMLSHANTFRLGNRSQTRIEKFSFTEFKTCFATYASESNSYSQKIYISSFWSTNIPIYASSYTYIYTYIHTYVSCKHIQVSPGPAAQLIAALGVKLVLAQFSEVTSPLFPCIRQLFQRHFVLQSQMNNDVLPGSEMSSGLARNVFWDVPGNSITKIQCAKLKGVSPSTTWACPQHLPVRPTLIHHKQLLSLS